MKLLFDHTLSPRLVRFLGTEFSGSQHVRDVGLAAAPDPTVWAYAAARGLMIVPRDMGRAMPTLKRKWWLCVAPASVCAFDAGLTLVFQPATYWAGQFDTVVEFSPPDRWLLAQHRLAFVAWVIVWIAACCLALAWLPTRASLVLALTLILNNATGAGSWVGARLPGGAWLEFGLFLVVGVLVVVTWAQAGVLTGAAAPGERHRSA